MKKTLIILISFIAFYGCKKDSDSNGTALTMANLAGSYKITAASSSGVNVYDIPAVFPPCLKDDIYTLTASGTITVNDGANVCSPTTSASGTYTVDASAKTITLVNVGSFSGTGEVSTFTSTTLVISQTNFQGTGFPAVITFTRQ